MVVFNKRWKKYNEIQLTKKQNGLEQSKNKKITSLARARAYRPRGRYARSSGGQSYRERSI